MTKPLVILTNPFIPEVIDRLLKPRARVKIVKTRAELLKLIPRATGLITRFSDRVDEELLARAPRLRAVSNFAVGIDNIDLASCARRGIRVFNTPDVLTRATAELTLTLLLACARRVPEGERMCRAGRFPGWDPRMLLGLDVKGRHAVLVGRGRIGSETARLFRALGIHVEWITRRDSRASIERKLRRAQILSLHFPLTTETRHWLNARRISLLPKDAIVLNTTRGPTIDEKALIRALRARRIFGAGLDVFEREPEIPAALRKLPNVVLLPHLGSATHLARSEMARLAVSGILRVLGQILGGARAPNEVKFLPRARVGRSGTNRKPR